MKSRTPLTPELGAALQPGYLVQRSLAVELAPSAWLGIRADTDERASGKLGSLGSKPDLLPEPHRIQPNPA
jgi:hypothetical protein